MKALFLAFVTLVLSACSSAPPPGPAATPAVAHAGKRVDLAGGGSAYLAEPAAKEGKHGAILVIQEWWGLNDWIMENADRFASQGHVALAVDLYRGKATKDKDEAHELMRGLPQDRGIADIKAGFELLAARPDVDPARIAIIGWCMGGGYALEYATVEPRLRAAVVNYGSLVTDAAKVGAIKASLLGDFGGKDRGIPAADVKAFEKSAKDAGKDVDFKVYDAAGHAFMNPNNQGGYDADAAKDAWTRIDAFLAKTIGG